ncbi:MAG TPA: MFS transporter [Candidatus Paceibacterota bacterium]|nr:MFS transporter [Candidatus Paceibacterota bacterium]HPT18338.1 MFS transporter [Candidatus Paceibacterota bacterium]
MRNNKNIVYLAGFLFSISIALTSYINSSFLEKYINEDYLGIVYILASVITIWSMLKIPKILTKLGNRFTALLFSITNFVAMLSLAYIDNIYAIIPAFILFFASMNFLYASLDIFIEDVSKNSSIGKFRGLFLMVMNLAWVIAQMVSGSIIKDGSFRGIYVFSASFMLLVSIIFSFCLSDFKDPKYTKVPVLNTIKVFLKNKNISKIYLINLILKLFFAWMVIYTPIYLYEYLHFNWGEIGIIFTIMLIPFVLIDYPLGKLSDKIGEKEVLIIGFLITILFTLLIPFINKPGIWIWAIILFGTRVGAASIEVMSETYFFKTIKEKNADEISFFRNTFPLSYIIAPMVAVPVLLFVPSFKYLFFIVTVFLLIGLLITLRLRDTQ